MQPRRGESAGDRSRIGGGEDDGPAPADPGTMARRLGVFLELEPEDLAQLELAARLHDVGKLAIDDSVLGVRRASGARFDPAVVAALVTLAEPGAAWTTA